MSDDIDESEAYLARINDWFVTNIEGIKPDNRKIYVQLFYDNNLTTERRILSKLSRYPNWLAEHDVDEFDAEDILEYLRTKGLDLTSLAAQTSGRRCHFNALTAIFSLIIFLVVSVIGISSRPSIALASIAPHMQEAVLTQSHNLLTPVAIPVQADGKNLPQPYTSFVNLFLFYVQVRLPERSIQFPLILPLKSPNDAKTKSNLKPLQVMTLFT